MSEIDRIPRHTYVTGSNYNNDFLVEIYPFDKYEIVVKLTLDRKFIGIEEVRLNKDFRSFKQQNAQESFARMDELPSE